MPGSKYVGDRNISANRDGRLVIETKPWKYNEASLPNEATDGSRGTDRLGQDQLARDGDNLSIANVNEIHDAKAPSEGQEQPNGRACKQRLLVVANRLPVSATRREQSWSLEMSAGGLVSGLLGVTNFEARWIGWAGVNVPDEPGQKSLTKALAKKSCIPVFLDEDIVHLYYNGYCNNILWPLFHYLGLPQEDRLATTRSFQSQFAAYQRANQMFADVVYRHYEEGDIVWCHDYHLMFLPKYLKNYNKKMKVGWFLHTPFPSSEIHRTLPSRSELLHSVLCADLVGFHTYDYARHFVSACTRILGLEGTPEGVEDQGKITRVAAFPIGIDSSRFIRALEASQVQENIRELKKRFGDRKVIIGVDRLDMIKGIPQKILAFEKFLEDNPLWHDKVVLLQIAVPTRTDVPEYQKLTGQVHEIVGRVNGRFGTLTALPIHHLDQSLDFHALCAIYAVTDVALVTSLRDGMNLVSYEFVACQDSKKGVLILSEFAGAAQSLGAGAILVNPWNITEVADSISHALNLSPKDREKRHRVNFKYVRDHTAEEWAATFVSELNNAVVEAQLRIKQEPPDLPVEITKECYSQSNNRLLILGFNSTLTEPVESPCRRGGEQIKEMEPKLHADLKLPLTALCSDPKTTAVILSGSERAVLDRNFGEFNMWLAAENGMFLRHTKGEWMTTMPENLNLEWLDGVEHVFRYFTERTPRSILDPRETSVVWNFKYADYEFGRIQARDVLQHLWTGPISNASIDVVRGNRCIEVRPLGVTKGAAIDRILGEIVHSNSMNPPIDYVLCIGHFLGKDEDLFTFFEPELPLDSLGAEKPKLADTVKLRRYDGALQLSSDGNRQRSCHGRVAWPSLSTEKRISDRSQEWPSREKVSWNVLDLKGENYFSCSVGRKHSRGRYSLASSDDVVRFLKGLSEATESSLLQPGQRGHSENSIQ